MLDVTDPTAVEIHVLETRLQQAKATENRLLTENRRLEDRVESLQNYRVLAERTRDFMPVLGVCCDGDGCSAALGLVGVKLVDADPISPHMVAIALNLGWSETAANGVRAYHYCPSCTEKRKASP